MLTKINAAARLYLLVLAMSVFIVGIGVYGLMEMKAMNRYTQTLYADRVLPMEQLTVIRFSYLSGIINSVEQAQTHQLSHEVAVQKMEDAEKTIARNWNAYLLTYMTQEERKIATQATVAMNQAAGVVDTLTSVLNKKDDLALDTLINRQFYAAVNPVLSQMNELLDLQVRVSGEVFNKSNNAYDASLQRFIVLIALSLLFAIPFSYLLVKKVKALIIDLDASNTRTAAEGRKYQAVIGHAGDAIFILDAQSVITEVNEAAALLLGYPKEELAGMKIDAFLSDAEQQQQALFFEQVHKNRNGLSERRLIRKDGIEVDTEINTRVFEDGYLSVIRNITERKTAETARKWTTELFKRQFENSPDYIVIINRAGVIESINRGAPGGPTVEELVGQNAIDMQPAESRQIATNAVNCCFETGENQEIEMLVRYGNWNRVRIVPIIYDGSAITHLMIISTNITERKVAEEKIRQSEASYRQLFDSSPVPMWLYDEATLRFLQVNQACINHYGYSKEAFTTMTLKDILPPLNEKDRDSTGKLNAQSPETAGAGRHRLKSGEIIDVITSRVPLVLNGRQQILQLAIDVTEKNRYEQLLTRAAIKAQEDERYEIGGELHDNVCQVLASALIMLGMLKKDISEKSTVYFESAHECITSASSEIRNLSHRLAPSFFEDATLEDLFDSLCAGFNVENKYDIRIYFDAAAKRWHLSRELQLNLYRILQEQLRNIYKYAKATTIDIDVTVSNQVLQLIVADDGVGFDAENNKSGGIGIANMNRRARLFSGAFLIDSAIGEGCKIMVVIPLPGD